MMVPELGHFALILALCIALVQSSLPLIGAARGNAAWVALARPAAQAQFLFIALAFGCLTYAFVSNDFSVKYVAEHSNTHLPLAYRVASVWGGHEGSLLLWTQMLGLWMLAVTIFSRSLPQEMVARVLSVMGMVAVGFLLFMLFTSNPFERLLPAAADGRDLNPLLQDPGMVFHPPMLYMGYVGFSVAFAFSMAALIDGRLDATWARWSRPWTTVAWSVLTLGIALGSGWAYYVLGWGGWWFWDPVENASFMPWLVGTALVHSLAVTEKRGAFRSWTVFLAILAFSLSLLGTFLVRSGVLTSVHAFATDPKRGIFILAFLAVVVGSSLTLFAWRASKVGLGGRFALVSRESMLLTNNALLLVAAAAVLLGTLYPLVLDAFGLGKISVGPPYFEAVFVPLMAPALFLMGIAPLARWKQASLPELAVRLRWAVAVSFAAAIIVPLVMGHWSTMVGFSMLLAAWIAASGVVNLKAQLATAPKGQIGARLAQLPRSYYGMLLAHFGVAVFIVGVALVKGYEAETDVRMEVGDTAHLHGYTFHFTAINPVKGPNYTSERGTIEVTRGTEPVVTLNPEKRLYIVQNMPMTEAAIDAGFTRHLYVALGDSITPTTWVVRIYHKPFVGWIWSGCLLMGIGGLLAAFDRRYRARVRAGSVQLAGASGLNASPAR
jgi:cytochrome c-type biogenesis protein CcmF